MKIAKKLLLSHLFKECLCLNSTIAPNLYTMTIFTATIDGIIR